MQRYCVKLRGQCKRTLNDRSQLLLSSFELLRLTSCNYANPLRSISRPAELNSPTSCPIRVYLGVKPKLQVQLSSKKGSAMDRRAILKSLAATTVTLPVLAAHADSGHCDGPTCMTDSAAVRKFLSDFIAKEEPTLDRTALIKLMHERGRSCCRALQFRQDLITNSAGNLDKLVELMGKIVGPENCRRTGNQITLVYPVTKCVCGWSPQRAPDPNDPYCECSAANNQALFEAVAGKPVTIQVTESPRRGGVHCRFHIQLS